MYMYVCLSHFFFLCVFEQGFYRKGTALVGLERQEEGMEAFSRCLTLDPSFHSAKVSLTKVTIDIWNLSLKFPFKHCAISYL